QELAEARLAGLDDEVGRPDRGRRAVAGARGAARGASAAALAACRVGVVEVAREAAALDQRRAGAGHALVVERRGGEARGLEPVVGQREGGGGDLVAEAPGERGAPALDRVGAEQPADEAGEAGGDRGVEHDRAGPRGGLGGAEQRGGALGGLAADRLGVEGLRRAPEPEPEPGLAVVAGGGD